MRLPGQLQKHTLGHKSLGMWEATLDPATLDSLNPQNQAEFLGVVLGNGRGMSEQGEWRKTVGPKQQRFRVWVLGFGVQGLGEAKTLLH